MKSSPWKTIETGRDPGFENLVGRIVHLPPSPVEHRMVQTHARASSGEIPRRAPVAANLSSIGR
jgi:hypothetical protein